MKPLSQSILAILMLALFAMQPAFAFQYPLSSQSIRQAYFLGKEESDRSAEVFAKYIRAFAPPKSGGPAVTTIEFETPYLVVADQVAQNQPSYFAPDAVKEFLGKPGVCRVRVQVYFPFNDLGNVTVQLLQDGKEIDRQSKHTVLLYTGDEGAIFAGVETDLDYAAEKIDPDSDATVRVTLENGTAVETTFDLSQLR